MMNRVIYNEFRNVWTHHQKCKAMLHDHKLDCAVRMFQQDNASCHASKSTQEWLKKDILPCHSRSPDLNPIKQIWGTLNCRVYGNNKQFSSSNEPDFNFVILREWHTIRQSVWRENGGPVSCWFSYLFCFRTSSLIVFNLFYMFKL